jgi:hypothetical protein
MVLGVLFQVSVRPRLFDLLGQLVVEFAAKLGQLGVQPADDG